MKISNSIPLAAFDLGTYLNIGYTSYQIYHMGGAMFCGIFGLLALRRITKVGGISVAIWGSFSVILLLLSCYIARRGFAEQFPEWLLPLVSDANLLRCGAIANLLVWAFFLIHAHWVDGMAAKWGYRSLGVGAVFIAIWLTVGWFQPQVPERVRPWTARTVLVKFFAVSALIIMAYSVWHANRRSHVGVVWVCRAFGTACVGGAIALSWHWFGSLTPPVAYRIVNNERILILTGIATACCLLIALGATWIVKQNTKSENE
ncbi:MAG: hypothetical protein R3B84_12365 [Zavarzinella sp.]